MTLTVRPAGALAFPSHSIDNASNGWRASGGVTGNMAWGTQYRAIYVPIRVPRRVVVRKMGWVTSGVAAGNSDVGIYDTSGTRLVSSGSTTNTSTTTTRVADITDTTVGPGLYYFALNNDTTTDTFTAFSLAAPIPASRGVLTETLGSVTLPATATWAVDQTLVFIPYITALLVTEIS